MTFKRTGVKLLAGALAVSCLIPACHKKAPELAGFAPAVESSTVKFWGYKLTVLVDATPEQLEAYITDTGKLKQEVSGVRIDQVSASRKMEKVGDSADYAIKIPGYAVSYRLTMIHYAPLQEIWYMTEISNELLVSVLRYQMKKVKDGTLLTVRFELEEPRSGLLKTIAEQINLQSLMVKGTEQGTAMIQAWFNKSLTVEGLLKKGLRGDYYVTFFSGNRVSSWIDASPQRVDEYMTSPETWARWEEQFKIRNMGPCLTAASEGACRAEITIMGIGYKLNFFNASYDPGKFTSSYFTSPIAGVGRLQTFIKPRDKGADLSIEYMIQISQSSTGATELLVSLSQLPKIIQEIVLDAKASLESPGKT